MASLQEAVAGAAGVGVETIQWMGDVVDAACDFKFAADDAEDAAGRAKEARRRKTMIAADHAASPIHWDELGAAKAKAADAERAARKANAAKADAERALKAAVRNFLAMKEEGA